MGSQDAQDWKMHHFRYDKCPNHSEDTKKKVIVIYTHTYRSKVKTNSCKVLAKNQNNSNFWPFHQSRFLKKDRIQSKPRNKTSNQTNKIIIYNPKIAPPRSIPNLHKCQTFRSQRTYPQSWLTKPKKNLQKHT